MKLFVFQESDELLAYCDLALVGGVEIDLGNGVLSLNLMDAGIMRVWFKTESQLKHEFLRLLSEQESYYDAIRKAASVEYTRH